MGLFVLYQFHETCTLYIIAQIAISYLILLLCDRKKCGHILFAESLVYLSLMHLRQMTIVEPAAGWSPMDIPTTLMIMTQKLHSIGFCFSDGGKKDEELT
jgi:hypothetical protein